MKSKKFLSVFGFLLAFISVLVISGCGSGSGSTETLPPNVEKTVVGEGEKNFTLTVTDTQGNISAYEINTDKQNVGEALLDLGLISGDPGPYGLYVKKVAGILAEFETNGKYWAFYINGELATSGVDTTDIVPGTIYSFKAQ